MWFWRRVLQNSTEHRYLQSLRYGRTLRWILWCSFHVDSMLMMKLLLCPNQLSWREKPQNILGSWFMKIAGRGWIIIWLLEQLARCLAQKLASCPSHYMDMFGMAQRCDQLRGWPQNTTGKHGIRHCTKGEIQLSRKYKMQPDKTETWRLIRVVRIKLPKNSLIFHIRWTWSDSRCGVE